MRKPTLVLSVALAGMVATSLLLWSERDGEHAVCPEFRSDKGALDLRQEDSGVPATAVAGAELLTGRAIDPVSKAGPNVPANTTRLQYYSGLQQRLMTNPRFRQALKKQQRVVLETEYRDLPEYLNLTPDQAERVFELMAEQSVDVLDLQRRDLRSSGEAQSRKDLLAQLRKQNETALTELLGSQNMNRLQQYRSTLQSRTEVSSVRNELAATSDPLRQDQVEPMVDLVNMELQRMNQELRDLSASGEEVADAKRSELAIAANQRIVDAAVPILTSVQLAALKDLYRRQRSQMEALEDLNRLRSEAAIVDAKAGAPN
jgi:hypothetical protein